LVASMSRHGWWYYYGYRQPEPPPRTFKDAPVKVLVDLDGIPFGPRTYYVTVAAMLRRLGIRAVEQQYFFLRAWSASLGIATVLVLWQANRKAFGPAVGLL